MKRPVILLLVASLLAGTSAFAAASNDKERLAGKVAEKAMRSKEAKSDVRQQRREDRRDDRRHEDRRNHDRRDHDRRDQDRRDWNRNANRDQRGWEHHRRDWDRHPNYWDNRRHDRRDHARYRYHFGHYRAPKGYYHRVWHRGDRLPKHWYAHHYVVYDYRPYRLYAPPYGYHWVRVGNDVLLTAVATGIVLDVLYDIWY